MLFETLGKLKQRTIMTSIVILAIGVMLLICPEKHIDTLITLAGYVMLVLSAVMILDFSTSKRSLSDFLLLVAALALAILGLAVLVSHNQVLPVLSWLFGLLLLVVGVLSAFNTFAFARRAGRAGWQILVILSILQILAGLVIVINPWWKTPRSLMSVIAFAMIFSSVIGILRLIWIWPIRSE